MKNRSHLKKLSFFIFPFLVFTLGEGRASVSSAPHPKIPISLTVSGGVSLGSYQAGYLYYSTQFLKQNKFDFDLKQMTGSSAGAVNVLLVALSACSSAKLSSPAESLFWQTWIPIGFKQLSGTSGRQKPSALFTTEALEQNSEAIATAWADGLDERCDLVMGITTTLLKPEQRTLGEDIQTMHQEEPFVFRIRGLGPGRPPEISNYIDPSDPVPHAMLYLPEAEHERFLALRDVLLASVAFPGAFPAKKLRFCRSNPRQPTQECTLPNSKEEYFIDGGVFDNEPLRLAIRTAARGLVQEKNGTFHWNDIPHLNRQFPPSQLRFRALDVDAKTYPAEPPKKKSSAGVPKDQADEEGENETFLSYVKNFVSRFVTTARSQPLYTVLEEDPNFPNSIASSKNYYPLASEPFFAFAGFLDKGFREFDFYLGMYDARQSLIRSMKSNITDRTVFPELTPDSEKARGADWIPFQCLLAKLDHRPELEYMCKDERTYNMKRLLQGSLDRLYSVCSDFEKDVITANFPHRDPDCSLAATGKMPPLVDSDFNNKNWKRGVEESEGLYNIRILNQNNYKFEIMSSQNPSVREVLTTFRTEILDAFDLLASRQPSLQKFALVFVGEPAFNLISYRPPPREIHFLLGEIVEAGGSLALSDWVRAHAAVTFQRPQDVFAETFGAFSISPSLGLELEIHPLSSAWVQPRLGARAGWQFAPHDSWGGGPCVNSSSSDFSCTRWMFESYIATTLYERLRIQFIGRFLPATQALPYEWRSFIQLGIELTP